MTKNKISSNPLMLKQVKILCTAAVILIPGLLFNCSTSTGPAKVKEGLTAKEAEQLASTLALERLALPFLVSIETPEGGGGVNRKGRLEKGEKGKWWYGYVETGQVFGLLVQVEGARAVADPVSLDLLGGLQEILPGYIDSSEALEKAEAGGGKDLEDVELILCNLTGEPVWPRISSTKVAWVVTYRQSNGARTIFYVEAYDGIFLGKG